MNIAARGIQMPSVEGTSAPVLDIIVAIKLYPCHQLSWNSKKIYWFPHKLTFSTAAVIDIIVSTAKYLTAALKQTNKNSLLTPSDTITLEALF